MYNIIPDSFNMNKLKKQIFSFSGLVSLLRMGLVLRVGWVFLTIMPYN